MPYIEPHVVQCVQPLQCCCRGFVEAYREVALGVCASQNCDAHVLPRIADVASWRQASRRSIAIALRSANAHARSNDGGTPMVITCHPPSITAMAYVYNAEEALQLLEDLDSDYSDDDCDGYIDYDDENCKRGGAQQEKGLEE